MADIVHHPYDVCIVHLADARFYPLFERQAFALRDAGYRVAFVSWERAHGEGNPHWEGIDVYPITIAAQSFSGKIFFARYLLALTRLLRRLPARLYQAVDPVTLPSVRYAARHHESRYAYFSLEFFQGTDSLVGRPAMRTLWYHMERWGLENARNAAVVCASSARRLAELYTIALPHVIRNVPPAAEYASVVPDGSLRKRLNLDSTVPLAVYKGDLAPARGIIPFIQALPAAPNVHFVLIGDGPFRREIERVAQQCGVATRVHCAGRVTPERFPSLLAEADLGHVMHENIGDNMPFTLPSKLFDYMHAGLAVIAGNKGEMAQIVTSRGIGWSVDPSDSSSIASALQQFSAGGETVDRMRNASRQAAKDFCWENEKNAYLAFIREALTENPSHT